MNTSAGRSVEASTCSTETRRRLGGVTVSDGAERRRRTGARAGRNSGSRHTPRVSTFEAAAASLASAPPSFPAAADARSSRRCTNRPNACGPR
jgi:hypothetical protein